MSLKDSLGGGLWCVLGDFNAVRRRRERRGVGNMSSNSSANCEIREFNEFVESLELLDIPMLNRKFTWYSSGAKS